MEKPNLWVFGDSFSVSFSKHFSSYNDWSYSYKNYKKGITPKIFPEIIVEKLNMNLINLSIGGCSNYQILSEFINVLENIKKNDILIFGWTSTNRFRLSNNFNQFVDITYALKHPSPNEFVSQKSLIEYAVNRSNNSVFLVEILEYIKLINFSFKNNKIIHWTWVSPDNQELGLNGKFDKKNYESKIIMVSQFFKLSENVKKYIKEFAGDFLFNGYDLKIEDFYKNGVIFNLVKEKKCIVIINIENISNICPVISSMFDVVDLHSDNYLQLFYSNIFPYKKYETIYDETNGVIDDLHYSENGHIEFAKDIMNHF